MIAAVNPRPMIDHAFMTQFLRGRCLEGGRPSHGNNARPELMGELLHSRLLRTLVLLQIVALMLLEGPLHYIDLRQDSRPGIAHSALTQINALLLVWYQTSVREVRKQEISHECNKLSRL